MPGIVNGMQEESVSTTRGCEDSGMTEEAHGENHSFLYRFPLSLLLYSVFRRLVNLPFSTHPCSSKLENCKNGHQRSSPYSC